MSSILTTISCPLCGEYEGTVLFTTRDYSLRITDQKFALRECNNCGVGYLSPRPNERAMGSFYPESFYWMHEGSIGKLSGTELLLVRKQQLEAKADCLAHLEGGRLLDIGAQKGDFIYWMQQKGWICEGVEYSDKPPNLFDMPIRYGEFLDMEWEQADFDCITMWAVLEHVYHPGKYIKKVASLMKPGGKFIGLATNLDSVQARHLKVDDYPRHLTIFTRKSLERTLELNGFRLDRCWTDQKIFGGRLHGIATYIVKRLLGYSDDEVLAEWKDPQRPDAFWSEWRGKPNWLVRQLSRFDKLFTVFPEKFLDHIGRGLLLTWEATYVGKNNV